LLKRTFRLDVRRFAFSNRMINSRHLFPAYCVNCNAGNTFKTHISAVLEPETVVNFDYVGQYALSGSTTVCIDFGGFSELGEFNCCWLRG